MEIATPLETLDMPFGKYNDKEQETDVEMA